jgi:hypothetical protein
MNTRSDNNSSNSNNNNGDDGKDGPSSVRSVDSTRVLSRLSRGRKELWNAQLHRTAAIVLDPVRDYVLDPILAVSSILLPPIAASFPWTDPVLTGIVHVHLLVVRLFYHHSLEPEDMDLLRSAKNDILVNSKAAGLHLPRFRPPSDVASAFRGAVAFTVSALADVVSVAMDRNKMKLWFSAVTEFKAFLAISGVGDELDEAIYKPLLRGRLLDNIKILNDIQEEMYVDRHKDVTTFASEDIQGPLKEGKR